MESTKPKIRLISPHLSRNRKFQFRWNTRKMDDGQRVARVVKQIDGKRLDYRKSIENLPYLPIRLTDGGPVSDMNDSMMPEWMRKKLEKKQLEEARAEAKKHGHSAAAKLIEFKRPSFWQQLQEQLAIALEFLPELDMAGEFSELSGNGVRVSVSRPGVSANHTYTDLFFKSDGITATGLNIGSYVLTFCIISDTEIGVTVDGSNAPMTAAEAAQYVMEHMMDLIEQRSH